MGKKKVTSPWLLLFIDIVLASSCLGIFLLFYHFLPSEKESENIVIDNPSEASSLSENSTTDASSDEGSSSTETTDWSEKFADKFTDEVIQTDNSYSSPDLSITVEQEAIGSGEDKVTYYVADIYMASIENFKTALAEDTYGSGITDTILDMDLENNAILATSGDFYGNSNEGVVIRNGVLYRSVQTNEDVLVLYYDGTMKTFSAGEFDEEEAIQDGAYQAWTFGPALLDEEGNAINSFHVSGHISEENPRMSIGYYEPGHYVLVAIDGRDRGYSVGMTLEEMSALFEELGCTTAYNLDGGKTAVMTFDDAIVNQPDEGGRESSDSIIISEVQ